MRRVLERLGFTLEGVMRAFMAGPTGREDYALYGVTRSDWQTREHLY
jgi:RimJ/RimL family protein N-acetyltransferase